MLKTKRVSSANRAAVKPPIAKGGRELGSQSLHHHQSVASDSTWRGGLSRETVVDDRRGRIFVASPSLPTSNQHGLPHRAAPRAPPVAPVVVVRQTADPTVRPRHVSHRGVLTRYVFKDRARERRDAPASARAHTLRHSSRLARAVRYADRPARRAPRL